MDTEIPIGTFFGVGGYLEGEPHGNVLESSSAARVDGVWTISTWTPDGGTVTRDATPEEAAVYEAQVAPPLTGAQTVVADLLALPDAEKLAAIAALAAALGL